MPKNSIGDFVVTIAAEVDKASFETSNRLVDNVGNSFNKLTGSARNAFNVLGNITMQQTQLGGSTYDLATKINVASEALDLWRATARLTTGDAKALDNALSKLSYVQLHLNYDAAGLNELQAGLNKLSIGYGEIENLSVDEQLDYILEQARKLVVDKGENKATIAQYVKDLFGPGAQQALLSIIDSGMSVESYKATEAKPKILTTAKDNENSAKFQKELRELQAEYDATKKLLGSNIATLLEPQLRRFNDWFDKNGDKIADAMDSLARAIEKIIGKSIDFITDEDNQNTIKDVVDAGKDVKNTIGGIKDFAKAVSSGDEKKKEEAKQKIVDAAKNAERRGLGMSEEEYADFETTRRLVEDYWDKNSGHKVPWYTDWNRIPYEDLPPDLKEKVDQNGGKENFPALKDGIIRPDGTVTQVAPDDWVFAARNIGDMARAFIPQNHTAVSGGEYSIVQNFTINGGNDMPQVLRQEAYRGTQQGLLEMMEQSSRRLQLMSGTR